LQPVPWANQVLAINTATRPACRLAARCSRDRQSPASPQQTVPQRELANERRRFGYRRLGPDAQTRRAAEEPEEGLRLYKEERLTVKTRRPQACAGHLVHWAELFGTKVS
jgi:hypothetical protein